MSALFSFANNHSFSPSDHFQTAQSQTELSLVSRAFLWITIFEVVAIICGCIAFLTQHADIPYATKAYTYVIISSCIWLAYLAFDAVFKENPFQLGAFLFVSVMLTLRVFFNFILSTDLQQRYVLIPLIIAGACQLVYIGLAYSVFQSFGWRVFRHVGTNTHMIALYTRYSFWLALLKVDLQFCTSIFLLGSFFVSYFTTTLAAVGGLLVLSFAMSYMAYNAAHKESVNQMIFFGIFSTAMVPYIIFKIVEMYTHPSLFFKDMDEIDTTRLTLTVSCILAVACRILLLIYTFIVARNFNSGLKEQVFERVVVAYGSIIPPASSMINNQPSPALSV